MPKTFEESEDEYYTKVLRRHAQINADCIYQRSYYQINNDLLQSLIELVDRIKYFPGELSEDHYAVKRAERLIDNIK